MDVKGNLMIDNIYLQPMQPYHGLEKHAHRIHLPKSNLEIFYYDTDRNDLPKMILVHGLGDDADTWRHLIEPLSEQWRVIAPDLPGYGRSQKPPIKYSLTYFSQVLLELINELGIKQPCWVGNSLGAILSSNIALISPEQVKSLVLIDGAMLQAEKQSINLMNILFLIPGIGKWLYNRLRNDPQAAYETLRPFYYDLDALPDEERKFLNYRVNQRVWDDQQRDAYLSTLRNMVLSLIGQQTVIQEKLSEVSIPTLIIWGEADQIYSLKNGELLNQVLPNSEMITFPQTGHLVQQERPEKLIAAILDFKGIDY